MPSSQDRKRAEPERPLREKLRETALLRASKDLESAFDLLNLFHGAKPDEIPEKARKHLESLEKPIESPEEAQRIITKEAEDYIVKAVHRHNQSLLDERVQKYLESKGLRGREFLRKLHRGLEKGVKDPIPWEDFELWWEIQTRKSRGHSYAEIHQELTQDGRFRMGLRPFQKKAKRLEETIGVYEMLGQTHQESEGQEPKSLSETLKILQKYRFNKS